MEQKKRIIITGATGFIGQHLLEDIDAEKYIITIITRDKSKTIRFLPDNCNILEADLLNLDSLINAFKNQDVLINLAAEVRDVKKLEQTNIIGTQNLLAAIAFNNIKYVIHLSSVGVVGKSYSSSVLNVDETSVCTPQNKYERTKNVSEMLFLESKKKSKFNLIILRPTNVYGEFHSFNALLGMMKHIQSGRIVAYQKAAMVNYIYVKDLTFLICNLIESKEELGIINIGKAETLENFFFTVAPNLNVKLKSIVIPFILVKFARLLGVRKINAISNKVCYSDSKLSAFYQYPYGLNEGLKRTIAHYKKLNLLHN